MHCRASGGWCRAGAYAGDSASSCFYDADASSEPGCRAIRNNPAPTATAPVARAVRSPAGARRSTVMAGATTAIARRSMTPDDQEDHHQTGTAVAAVEAAVQAVSPGRASVGRQRTAVPGRLPAVGEVTRLPRGKLEATGHQNDLTDRDRYGARQLWLPHLDRRQRDTQRKSGQSEHGPDEGARTIGGAPSAFFSCPRSRWRFRSFSCTT
jgi:hypothetical protein